MLKDSLKNYENIIIIGGKDAVLSATYSDENVNDFNKQLKQKISLDNIKVDINTSRKFKDCLLYSNKENATELNQLQVINKYLTRIKNIKKELERTNTKDTTTCTIIIEDSTLYDKICKNTYINWVLNEGRLRNGFRLNKAELKEWTKLRDNMLYVIDRVKFKSLKNCTINKPMYNTTKIEFNKIVTQALKELYIEETSRKLEKAIKEN